MHHRWPWRASFHIDGCPEGQHLAFTEFFEDDDTLPF
jgi:hypothetical protein